MQKLKLVLRKRMIPKVRNSFMTEVPHRNQSIDLHRTGFYMIGTSLMKELR